MSPGRNSHSCFSCGKHTFKRQIHGQDDSWSHRVKTKQVEVSRKKRVYVCHKVWYLFFLTLFNSLLYSAISSTSPWIWKDHPTCNRFKTSYYYESFESLLLPHNFYLIWTILTMKLRNVEIVLEHAMLLH